MTKNVENLIARKTEIIKALQASIASNEDAAIIRNLRNEIDELDSVIRRNIPAWN
jgi:hypothetical protein